MSDDGDLATAALSTNLPSPASASSTEAETAVKVTLFYNPFRKAREVSDP